MNRKLLIEEIDTQISEFKNIIKSENNHDILEEKILDLLGEIEKKVFQIVGNKNNSTPLQKEIIFQRFVAMHIIDTQYTSIDDFLNELIEKLSEEVVNRKIILGHDLFIPGTSSIESNGIKNKKEKLKVSQKNKILQRVLYKLGYSFSEIDIFEEKLNPNRMRNIPYNIFHINKSGIQKTILICDQIGQATFVYDEIIDTNILRNIEKGELIGNSQALKIIYSQKIFEKNLEIALLEKLTFEEKEENIVNEEEKHEDNIVKENYTIEELINLSIPENVLGANKYWKLYAREINKQNLYKKLPLTLDTLANLLGCRRLKKLLMKKLGMKVKEKYTILELQDLNIPEKILGFDKYWKLYAEDINNNSDKKLPLGLRGLGNLLGCKGIKHELMKKIGMKVKEKYTISELKNLNMPEDIFGVRIKWQIYAEKINKENSDKTLPPTIKGLAKLLGCDEIKNKIKVKLGMMIKEKYTISELYDLNIPEQVLGTDKHWKPYVEEINKNNSDKKLPLGLRGLGDLLGCKGIKHELMKKLGMKVKEKYTILELKDLNIPENILGDDKYWSQYAKEINKKNTNKKLPVSLKGLASLLSCKIIKAEFIIALGI